MPGTLPRTRPRLGSKGGGSDRLYLRRSRRGRGRSFDSGCGLVRGHDPVSVPVPEAEGDE